MGGPRPENPLIVQGDHTVLLEVDHPRYEEARDSLLAFAELVKSPEHIHTYRLTPLSIWNARSAGLQSEEIATRLCDLSRYQVPENVLTEIRERASRYGRLRLMADEKGLLLAADDAALGAEIFHHRLVAKHLSHQISERVVRVEGQERGRLKLALVKVGFPVEDLAGYVPGERISMGLRSVTRKGAGFALREYQQESVDAFHAGGGVRGGSGIVVLPCGAGKTMVGLACMAALETSTLILATGITAVRQWLDELLDKTTLEPEDVGEYSGAAKDVRPVTVATYQVLTHRPRAGASFPHLELFQRRDWGLVIYDEVQVVPAPVFQMTAGLQARRRLGLTATLVREDGREEDAFALIGPKKVDVPWKTLEREGWVAKALCAEIRVPLPDEQAMSYALASEREKFRLASENRHKLSLVRQLLERHRDEPVLVLGMYVRQLEDVGRHLDLPVVTGKTPQRRRDQLYAAFRSGEIKSLALSKVGNFALDLPEASVAIQISGTFGSRQEEAQRLGRILRPKSGENQAHFYSLVSRDTVEQDFAMRRQLFLCEQGYEYRILAAEEIAGEAASYGESVLS